jgi:hypothetical protein
MGGGMTLVTLFDEFDVLVLWVDALVPDNSRD